MKFGYVYKWPMLYPVMVYRAWSFGTMVKPYLLGLLVVTRLARWIVTHVQWGVTVLVSEQGYEFILIGLWSIKSWDERLIIWVSESYYGMVRDWRPRKWIFTHFKFIFYVYMVNRSFYSAQDVVYYCDDPCFFTTWQHGSPLIWSLLWVS